MTNSLSKRAVSKFQEEGLFSLIESTANFTLRRAWQNMILYDDDSIFSPASEVVPIEDEERIEISYDGIWEPPHPKPIEAATGEGKINQRVVLDFGQSHLLGKVPIVYTGRHLIHPQNITTWETWTGSSLSLGDLVRSSMERFKSSNSIESGFLISRYPRSFSHWSTEVLPKLRAYEEYSQVTDSKPDLIIHSDLTSWQKESLRLMGYNPESMIKHKNKTNFKELLVPSHRYLTGRGPAMYTSPNDLKWVRDRAVKNLPDEEAQFGDRIFISRSDADRRRVLNRDEVNEVLERNNFEIHVPGELSFPDQVRLFNSAEVIVGPHGAGLMNGVFAENATLVEFVLNEETNIHHFVLANLLGLDYEYVSCDPKREEGISLKHSDMIVDPEKLEQVIHEVI
jgi:hypothetical protein